MFPSDQLCLWIKPSVSNTHLHILWGFFCPYITSHVPVICRAAAILTRHPTASFMDFFFYFKCAFKPLLFTVFHVSFSFICRSAAIQFCYVVLHIRRSTLSSASACTSQKIQQNFSDISGVCLSIYHQYQFVLIVWPFNIIPNDDLAGRETFALLG